MTFSFIVLYHYIIKAPTSILNIHNNAFYFYKYWNYNTNLIENVFSNIF